MKTDEPDTQSLLYKPISQLTEEDIAQLTREDCRKFLRDKGMRRPSWNKSQAIEQVISLKTLLEPRTESENQAERIQVSRLENSAQLPLSEKKNVGDLQISVSASESGSGQRRGSPVGDVASVTETAPDRSPNLTKGQLGQMTIFYCGKVFVYDSVPSDKALTIMQIASSNTTMPQDSPASGNAPVQPFACQLQVASIRSGLTFSSGVSPSMHVVTEFSQQYRDAVALTRDVEPEGPQSRKASVQRYLEKRKDRGRFKIKRKGESSSNLEMYLNHHQLRDQNPNEQSSQSRGSSPPQPRPPHTPTRCSSVDNQPPKNAALSIDLN
ncbi:Protein TIFY 4B-like isoform X1 [Ranunculus cassubicifolius]